MRHDSAGIIFYFFLLLFWYSSYHIRKYCREQFSDYFSIHLLYYTIHQVWHEFSELCSLLFLFFFVHCDVNEQWLSNGEKMWGQRMMRNLYFIWNTPKPYQGSYTIQYSLLKIFGSLEEKNWGIIVLVQLLDIFVIIFMLIYICTKWK